MKLKQDVDDSRRLLVPVIGTIRLHSIRPPLFTAFISFCACEGPPHFLLRSLIFLFCIHTSPGSYFSGIAPVLSPYRMATSPAGRMLSRQLQQMQSDKDIPGISCGLVDSNVFEWEVMLMISDDVKLYGGMAFIEIPGLVDSRYRNLGNSSSSGSSVWGLFR
jgi:hypothetical protein